jgi:hypothetical protein
VGGSEIFRTLPDPPSGPPSLLYNTYRGFLMGVKRPGRGVNHRPPSSAEVKERLEVYLCSPVWGFMASSRANFTFYVQDNSKRLVSFLHPSAFFSILVDTSVNNNVACASDEHPARNIYSIKCTVLHLGEGSSKTFVPVHQTTRYNILEDSSTSIRPSDPETLLQQIYRPQCRIVTQKRQ